MKTLRAYVAVDNLRGDAPVFRDSFQVLGDPIDWSLRVSGSPIWVLGSPIPFAVRVLCDTGPHPTVPTLSSLTPPAVGEMLELRMSQVPANAPVAICTGISNAQFGNRLLPLDMSALGAPGCLLHTSIENIVPATSDAQGLVQAPLRLPIADHLVGRTFYQQALVLDPAANQLAVTVSDAAEVLVGGRAR